MKVKDIESANKKIDEVEAKYYESNEEAKKFVASVGTLYKVIKYGESSIRIRAFMPRVVRLRVLKAGRILQEVKTDEEIRKADEMIYPILAEMCVDKPFNEDKFWRYVDNQTGCAQKVLMDMMEEVSSTEKKVETFRTE
jgi:hypothetical protein